MFGLQNAIKYHIKIDSNWEDNLCSEKDKIWKKDCKILITVNCKIVRKITAETFAFCKIEEHFSE